MPPASSMIRARYLNACSFPEVAAIMRGVSPVVVVHHVRARARVGYTNSFIGGPKRLRNCIRDTKDT